MSEFNSCETYKDWHISILKGHYTLQQAVGSMREVRAEQEDIPLMVQLVENPKYKIPGLDIFHGAVDIVQHDYIHICLGRGMLEKDEAFTIGFTMGSTNKVGTTEELLYSLVSKYFYPKVYQFSDDEIAIFKNAIRLAYISSCQPLDEFDFNPYLDQRLDVLREALGLEVELLAAYYKIEANRYPDSIDSKRLLD